MTLNVISLGHALKSLTSLVAMNGTPGFHDHPDMNLRHQNYHPKNFSSKVMIYS